MTGVIRQIVRAHAGPCMCPTCVIGRAVKDIDAALNATVEHGTEAEGNVYWLRDEVEAVCKSWWSWPVRKRLREALGASQGPPMPKIVTTYSEARAPVTRRMAPPIRVGPGQPATDKGDE